MKITSKKTVVTGEKETVNALYLLRYTVDEQSHKLRDLHAQVEKKVVSEDGESSRKQLGSIMYDNSYMRVSRFPEAEDIGVYTQEVLDIVNELKVENEVKTVNE